MENKYFRTNCGHKIEAHALTSNSDYQTRCIETIVSSPKQLQIGSNSSMCENFPSRSVRHAYRRTKHEPTVVRLRDLKKSALDLSSPRDKNDESKVEGWEATRRKSISTKVLSLSSDPDLTLLDNLDWIINFPVRSLFHCILDEIPACDKTDFQRNSSQRMEFLDGDQKPSLEVENSLNEWSGATPSFDACSPLRSCSSGKPTLTYPQLIERCLREKGAVTVNEIYQWISNRYPFYEDTDDGWKNAVRHNLSMQSQFRKGEKVRGKSHIWYLDDNYRKETKRPSHRTSYIVSGNGTELFLSYNTNIKYDGYQQEGFHFVQNTCLDRNERVQDSGSVTRSEVNDSFADSNGGILGEATFDREQTWPYLSGDISDPASAVGSNSPVWVTQNGYSLESNFGEYSGTSSAENYFQPEIPKLECTDFIHEFEVTKDDVTTDDLLQVLDAMVEENCSLSLS